jgi:hypothetical protein
LKLRAVFFWKIHSLPKFLGFLLPQKGYALPNFDKNGLGYILGGFFGKLIWSPCSAAEW